MSFGDLIIEDPPEPSEPAGNRIKVDGQWLPVAYYVLLRKNSRNNRYQVISRLTKETKPVQFESIDKALAHAVLAKFKPDGCRLAAVPRREGMPDKVFPLSEKQQNAFQQQLQAQLDRPKYRPKSYGMVAKSPKA